MKLTLKHTVTAFLLMLSFVAPVAAGPREDAWDAFSRKDYATAALLFRPLAENGDRRAQFTLGWMYHMGFGVLEDYAEALKWLRLAADQGVPEAQSNLGFMYRDGEGVQQDYEQAHMWFNLAAAAAGEPYSMYSEYRDDVAKKMTPAQIAEAQKLAREWKPTTPR